MANLPITSNTSHIQLKHIFGHNTQIKNNIYFQDEEKIIYPAGYHTVQYDTKEKSQTWYQGVNEYRGVTCLSLSPLRNFLAVGVLGIASEKQEKPEKPAIVIYDTASQKRKKILTFQEGSIKSWISVQFATQSMESKYLFALSGGDEIVAAFWQHDKNLNPITMIKISQTLLDIYEIGFNQNDYHQFSCIGKNIFKYYKIIESIDENQKKVFTIKSQCVELNGSPPNLTKQYTTHQWLSSDRQLIICTFEGDVILTNEQAGFFKILIDSPNQILKKQIEIKCMAIYGKGFCVGTVEGEICIYQKTQQFSLELLEQNYKLLQLIDMKLQIDVKDVVPSIQGLNFTPHSEDRLAVSLSTSSVYQVLIRKLQGEILGDSEDIYEQLTPNFHTSQVIGLDICAKRPLIATCSNDKTIKVWNYKDKSLELTWTYDTKPNSIAFHPSGLYLVAGFQGAIRMMSILFHDASNMNKHKFYKEISSIKNCKEIKFSNGGQYFAAVNSSATPNTLNIFKFFTADNPVIIAIQSINFKNICSKLREFYYESLIIWILQQVVVKYKSIDHLLIALLKQQNFGAL